MAHRPDNSIIVLFIICGTICSTVLGRIPLDIGLKCVIAVVVISILIGVKHMSSVQPVLWRLVFWLFILYILMLVFVFFQSLDDTRHFLTHIDGKLGKPQLEQKYAEDCSIYTPSNPNGTFANIVDNLDFYVLCHFFGWWIKALMIRDPWLLIISSFIFELMEYTFQYQLPSLEECWWDHWILDFLICNCLGIWMGMMTCNYLGLRTYELWKTSVPKRKLQCVVNTSYNTQQSCAEHFFIVTGAIVIILIQEMNTFYLEAIFWIPSNHNLTLYRNVLYMLCGSCVAKEASDYLQYRDVNAGIGHFTLLIVISITMEIILEIKFGWDIVTLPIPSHIYLAWTVFFFAFFLWTFWYLKYGYIPYPRRWTQNLIGKSKDACH